MTDSWLVWRYVCGCKWYPCKVGGEAVTNYHDAALSMEPWDREPNSDHDVDLGGVGVFVMEVW